MISGSRTTAAVLASLLLTGPALAQKSSSSNVQIASDLVKKAIAKSQAGDHSAAIDIYLQAYNIVPSSALLSNIGTEYQQSGKPQEALRYFCMYLDKEPSGANAPYATSQARALQIQLGNKNVDDSNVCEPPTPTPAVEDVPRDAESRPTKTRVKPDPDHATLEAQPTRTGNRTLRYAAYTSGGLGLGVVLYGVYAGARASSIADDISSHDNTMAWPSDIRAMQKRGESYETRQIAGLAAGGVLLATGAVLFVISRRGSSSEHASDKATVRVTPTANGFAVSGQF